MRTALPCLVAFAAILLASPPARAANEDRGYSMPMAVCEAAAAVPFVGATGFLGARFYVDAYTRNTAPPIRNQTEARVYLGTLALAGVGYVGCGPALHLAHGRPGAAALSTALRIGLPAAGIAMTYGFAKMIERPGDHFGDGLLIGLFGAVVVPGSFGLAMAADHSWLARVTPTAAPTDTHGHGALAGVAVTF
jgi:hypothetical protein